MEQAIQSLGDVAEREWASDLSEPIDFSGLLKRINAGDVRRGVESLVLQLASLRSRIERDQWRRFIGEQARQHPICEVVHTDPFTYHAYSKPRGYPGDAELLDYMYDPIDPRSATDTLAAKIAGYTTNAAASRAVRNRRNLLARLIDTTAAQTQQRPRILSLACGHLREAGQSEALRAGKVGEFIAIDQDEASLEVVRRDYSALGVNAQWGSVKRILVRGLSEWGFDLIYASGLFDYLSQPVGRRLCEVLFAALNPGGRLVVPNFMPVIADVGYMETFMDWFLVYRNRAQVLDLTAGIPSSDVAEMTSWKDDEENVVYVMAQKRSLASVRSGSGK
jgi:hypothetical protein